VRRAQRVALDNRRVTSVNRIRVGEGDGMLDRIRVGEGDGMLDRIRVGRSTAAPQA